MSRRVLCSLIVAAVVVLTAALAAPSAPRPSAAAPASPSDSPASFLAGLADRDPGRKLAPDLRAVVAAGDADAALWVIVRSTRRLDLTAFARLAHQFAWPAGEQVAVARVRAGDVSGIAALPGVYAVDVGDPQRGGVAAVRADGVADEPEGDEVAGTVRIDPRVLAARLRAAAPWVAAGESPNVGTVGAMGTADTTAPSDPVTGRARTGAGAGAPTAARGSVAPGTDDWFEIGRGHAVTEAWSLGYRGAGVAVAVLDHPVDFAHPDLQDTWRVLPAGHPYAGWPQVFDPYAQYLTVLDRDLPPEERSTRTAESGLIELYQTSAVTEREIGGQTVPSACFAPLVARRDGSVGLAEAVCDYVVPGTSKSGEVRFGHHPDPVLAATGALPAAGILAEAVGVLGVDATSAGLYDTIYVDLDGDHDFTDEKPMTKASPLSWRDLNGDDLADVSGGLLYFIADGTRPLPAAWVWGLENVVPEAGRLVGILWADGDHGTLCASHIASQGKVGFPPGRVFALRDLPGGQPEGINYGLAPEAKVVSIGSVYADEPSMFAPAWRYAVFGHERDRTDDDIQIASNSYGFSDVDNDGWDADSRLMDFYVRRYAPSTTFLVATGNGAPGYGTITAPKPVVAMGIGAATQMGSTGWDSITDTTQITFGDVVPWSNRGPTANGRVGVSLVADGAFAAGGSPLNFVGDGALANRTWSGTSRAAPVAAGATALVYQAFQAREGRWPTWAETQAILMAGARYAAYDVLTMGAGVLDAADAVRVAAGTYGVYATPAEWVPGDYHGADHPAFAHLVAPRLAVTTAITLTNPADEPLRLRLSAAHLRRIGSHDASLTVEADAESPSGPAPDYLLPIERGVIPADTELMIVRGRMPLDELDTNGDLTADNTLAFYVYQHTDVNGNGRLWTDANGNGAVNHRTAFGAEVALAWADQTRHLEAAQGDTTRQLTETGVTAPLGWFGRGCNVDARPDDMSGRIALVERGLCTNGEKIMNAQRVGAVGVLMYTDARPLLMVVRGTGIAIPGVLIDRKPGQELRDLLLAGTAVTATLSARDVPRIGLDGDQAVRFAESEIEQYEYMRVNYDSGTRNQWHVGVHHPLERWADGLYVGVRHLNRAIPTTHISLRYDFYAYEVWDDLSLSPNELTVPARGAAVVDATVLVGPQPPSGVWQAAIFLDEVPGGPTNLYLPLAARGVDVRAARPPRVAGAQALGTGRHIGAAGGDTLAPGGYKPPRKRTVIPVLMHVAAPYGGVGSVTLGGPAAHEPDVPYNNGATWGAFRWDWREESGDWRSFFVDMPGAPVTNTLWLLRTTWSDLETGQSDIDTRLFGPTSDRFTDPADPANEAENAADPDWFGPYTLGLLARSPYLANGSRWPFQTTSGAHEDWVAAPARAGLHQVMLHNVLHSGSQFELPFESTVSAVELDRSRIDLVGAACASLTITSQLALPDFHASGLGLSVPQVLADQPVVQDGSAVVSATWRHELSLDTMAARFAVRLDGEDDDDLDLYVLFDANGDGAFTYPAERVAFAAGDTADETVTLPSFAAAGDYQIWVHGARVTGEASTFDLLLDIVAGADLTVTGAPEEVAVGTPVRLEVCADNTLLAGEDGPASGLLLLGPGAAPRLVQVPVGWRPASDGDGHRPN